MFTWGGQIEKVNLRWWQGHERASQEALVVDPACQCRRHKRRRFSPWVGKIPWRRAWPPTPVFLPGEPQGERSLGGCSPWMGSHRVGHNWSDFAHIHTGALEPERQVRERKGPWAKEVGAGVPLTLGRSGKVPPISRHLSRSLKKARPWALGGQRQTAGRRRFPAARNQAGPVWRRGLARARVLQAEGATPVHPGLWSPPSLRGQWPALTWRASSPATVPSCPVAGSPSQWKALPSSWLWHTPPLLKVHRPPRIQRSSYTYTIILSKGAWRLGASSQ